MRPPVAVATLKNLALEVVTEDLSIHHLALVAPVPALGAAFQLELY
jgi:hypothetical protein